MSRETQPTRRSGTGAGSVPTRRRRPARCRHCVLRRARGSLQGRQARPRRHRASRRPERLEPRRPCSSRSPHRRSAPAAAEQAVRTAPAAGCVPPRRRSRRSPAISTRSGCVERPRDRRTDVPRGSVTHASRPVGHRVDNGADVCRSASRGRTRSAGAPLFAVAPDLDDECAATEEWHDFDVVVGDVGRHALARRQSERRGRRRRSPGSGYERRRCR